MNGTTVEVAVPFDAAVLLEDAVVAADVVYTAALDVAEAE